MARLARTTHAALTVAACVVTVAGRPPLNVARNGSTCAGTGLPPPCDAHAVISIGTRPMCFRVFTNTSWEGVALVSAAALQEVTGGGGEPRADAPEREWQALARAYPRARVFVFCEPIATGVHAALHPIRRERKLDLIMMPSHRTYTCDTKLRELRRGVSLSAAKQFTHIVVLSARYGDVCDAAGLRSKLLLWPYLQEALPGEAPMAPTLAEWARRRAELRADRWARMANGTFLARTGSPSIVFTGGIAERRFVELLRAVSDTELSVQVWGADHRKLPRQLCELGGMRAPQCVIVGKRPVEQFKAAMDEALLIAVPLKRPPSKPITGLTTVVEAIQRSKTVAVSSFRETYDGYLEHERTGFRLGSGCEAWKSVLNTMLAAARDGAALARMEERVHDASVMYTRECYLALMRSWLQRWGVTAWPDAMKPNPPCPLFDNHVFDKRRGPWRGNASAASSSPPERLPLLKASKCRPAGKVMIR